MASYGLCKCYGSWVENYKSKSNLYFAVSAKLGFVSVKSADVFIGSAASHDDVPDPIIAIEDLFMVFFCGMSFSLARYTRVLFVYTRTSCPFEIFPSSFVQFHLSPASCLFTASAFTVIPWTCASLLLGKIKWRRSFIAAPKARWQMYTSLKAPFAYRRRQSDRRHRCGPASG